MGILQIVAIIVAFSYECICFNDSLDKMKRVDRTIEIRSTGEFHAEIWPKLHIIVVIYLFSLECYLNLIWCPILDEECTWIDNQYWSYGDYQTIHDVSDYMACCRLCKEDSECTNFSYGKEGHGYAKQCFKKRGGSAQGRSEFISSPRNISECSCGKGGFIFPDFNV